MGSVIMKGNPFSREEYFAFCPGQNKLNEEIFNLHDAVKLSALLEFARHSAAGFYFSDLLVTRLGQYILGARDSLTRGQYREKYGLLAFLSHQSQKTPKLSSTQFANGSKCLCKKYHLRTFTRKHFRLFETSDFRISVENSEEKTSFEEAVKF